MKLSEARVLALDANSMSRETLRRGMARRPDAIALDVRGAWGPHEPASAAAAKDALSLLLPAASNADVPLMVGNIGWGADADLSWCRTVLMGVTEEQGVHVRLAIVHAEQMTNAEPLVQALGAGAEMVLAGRVFPPALFAASPLHRGFPTDTAMRMGELLAAMKGGALGIVTAVGFSLHSLSANGLGGGQACTYADAPGACGGPFDVSMEFL